MKIPKLSQNEINEEIEFFQEICGWKDEHALEDRLGLSRGTLGQRRTRQARKNNTS